MTQRMPLRGGIDMRQQATLINAQSRGCPGSRVRAGKSGVSNPTRLDCRHPHSAHTRNVAFHRKKVLLLTAFEEKGDSIPLS